MEKGKTIVWATLLKSKHYLYSCCCAVPVSTQYPIFVRTTLSTVTHKSFDVFSAGFGRPLVILAKPKWHDYYNLPPDVLSCRPVVFRFEMKFPDRNLKKLHIFCVSQELNPRFQITAAPTFGNLPTAHTCFNQLCLPDYESYEHFEKALLIALSEGTEGFGMV